MRDSHPKSLVLSTEERNALTQCYVVCRGFNTVGLSGDLAKYIRNEYPESGFDIVAEAFADAMKGDIRPSVVRLEKLMNYVGEHKQKLRALTNKLQNLK